jgi:hypothetical protein
MSENPSEDKFDFRFQISRFRLQISHFKVQILDYYKLHSHEGKRARTCTFARLFMAQGDQNGRLKRFQLA